jgi:hypothetical protein
MPALKSVTFPVDTQAGSKRGLFVCRQGRRPQPQSSPARLWTGAPVEAQLE